MNKKIFGILLICVLFVGFLFSYKDSCLLVPKKEINATIGGIEEKQILSFKDKDLCESVSNKANIPIEDVLSVACLADCSKINSTGFWVKDCIPVNMHEFKKQLAFAKSQQYRICNHKTKKYHTLTCKYGLKTENYIILPLKEIKGYQPCSFCINNNKTKNLLNKKDKKYTSLTRPSLFFANDYFKIILSDHTTVLKPSKSCNSLICQELVKEINLAQSSIDMALYGYEIIPAIDNALKNAKKRGVCVRFVYDVDSNDENIYPDTKYFTRLSENSRSDYGINGLMHNKFFIFDKQTVLTGSANISATDMSGFNSNSVIIIKSKNVAKLYEDEFMQMLNGNFHNLKQNNNAKQDFILGGSRLSVYFSPKDNAIKNAILPLINNANKYIYIPAFLITEKEITSALVNAKSRGVDVKIIIDAVSGRSNYTKHKILREAGILVKTENYAGKLHSKSIIVDDKYVVIGSMNFSNSGNYRNDENLIVIKDTKTAVFYRKYFEYLWARINDFWLIHDVAPESKYSIGSLSDGIDNDYDGLIDEQE